MSKPNQTSQKWRVARVKINFTRRRKYCRLIPKFWVHTLDITKLVGPNIPGQSRSRPTARAARAPGSTRGGGGCRGCPPMLLELHASPLAPVPPARGLLLSRRAGCMMRIRQLWSEGVPGLSAHASSAACVLPLSRATFARTKFIGPVKDIYNICIYIYTHIYIYIYTYMYIAGKSYLNLVSHNTGLEEERGAGAVRPGLQRRVRLAPRARHLCANQIN